MSDQTLLSPEFADDALLVAVANGEATLAEGVSDSASVLAVQKALVILEAKIKPDGDFGPRTRAALVAFQAAEGLPESGILDAETLSVLDQRVAERRKKSLDDAIARAVGANAHRPAPRPAPAPVTTPTDSRFFTDASELTSFGAQAVDDPDSPPPEVDRPPAAGSPLGSERQTMLARLREAMGDDGPANAALERLFVAGRLLSGKLLPHLATMATTRRHPELILQGGIESGLLLRQVLRHVDNPLRVRQGMGRGTCGAGVVEYLLLRRDPAEFVRLVDGITGFSGQSTLRSKRTITLPRTAIARDDTKRVDVDRLFQSTIMNHATAMSWLFDYDNAKDDESFWAAVQGNTQMPIWGFASIYEDVMGERRTSVSIASRPKDEIGELVVAEALKGDRVPVIVRFNALHWLSVESIVRDAGGRASSLILRNPWGWDEGGDEPRRVAMPEGGGRIRMEYGDLIDALVGAVVKG